MNVKNLQSGAYAGLVGGVVFGAMMAMMGMLPMIGQMVGYPSALTGFVVHLFISALIGISFAALFHSFIDSTAGGAGYGLLYGGAWWLLGPLTLMPLLMGMGLGVNWNAESAVAMLPSLVGHFIYGAILGTTYVWLSTREIDKERSSDPQMPTLAELCMYNSLQSPATPKERRIG